MYGLGLVLIIFEGLIAHYITNMYVRDTLDWITAIFTPFKPFTSNLTRLILENALKELP